MAYSFFLSYARKDAVTGEPRQPDPHFESFVKRLELKVGQLTAGSGFVDRTDIQEGQEWPDRLAEALQTAQTMVCLYSPAYFQSEYCGKEMQVFLDRRRQYIDINGGKKPSNIIPVVWQPVPLRIPATLPDIQYKVVNVDPDDEMGVWDLGDKKKTEELNAVADQLAKRVRNAADESPLKPLPQRPRIQAVRSAFLPPPLPLPEFELPEGAAGPDTVTFVYSSSKRWDAWPWSPPDSQAVLYLAAAVAKGREMVSTQLTFDLADTNLAARLAALQRRNNVVILFVDVADLGVLRARMQEFDRPEHASFALIAIVNQECSAELRAGIDKTFPFFAKRSVPYYRLVATPGTFNSKTRESFSKVVAEALEQLRLGVANNPYAPNVISDATGFQSLPSVAGPARAK